MRHLGKILLVATGSLFAGVAGCAASHPAVSRAPAPVTQSGGAPATQPGDPRQWLSLGQIPNAPVLAPTTAPSDQLPPLESVRLYALAHEAQLDDQSAQATHDLEQACRLDPSSFVLQYALARLYASAGDATGGEPLGGRDNPLTLAALENAEKIEPDHLRLQIDLGREYLERGVLTPALRHLRLATQTTEYRGDDPLSAVADFFLANVLTRQGYLRAALNQYRLLTDRLGNPSMAMRGNGETAILIAHLDSFQDQIGALEEKLGEYPQALKIYEPMLAGDPSNVALTGRVVAALLGCNRGADAIDRAVRVVELQHGSDDSVVVLDAACRGARDLGLSDADLATELGRLHQGHRTDRGLLYAWVDALHAEKQDHRALDALAVIAATEPFDPQLLRRRFTLMRQSTDAGNTGGGGAAAGGADGAARMLIASLAQTPALSEQIEPFFDELLRPGRLPYLSLAQLQNLSVPADQQQAKEFCVAYAAEIFGREALAESALQQANAAGTYAPAAREQLANIWIASDLTEAQELAGAAKLADRAAAGRNEQLADELRGLALLEQKKPRDALMTFTGSSSPQFLLERAQAMRQAGDRTGFEAAMWALLSDWPGFGRAYVALVDFYESHDQTDQAARVVHTWLGADPGNTIARRLEVRQLFAAGDFPAARSRVLQLLENHDDDPQVLAEAVAVEDQLGQLTPLMARLADHAARDPANLALAGTLAEWYGQKNRLADAQRVLDATAAKLADNPDLMYQLSGVYHRLGLADRSEDVLSVVLKLDPNYAGAANDLGYYWADASEHLPQAEALVRRAIAAEPHNAAFLDSLGWVLYKLGRYAEASGYLQTAAMPRESADPVVLNHLGDALYRLGQSKAAGAAWETAADRITDSDDSERTTLRTLLRRKSQQLKDNEPVDVAPSNRPTTSALP